MRRTEQQKGTRHTHRGGARAGAGRPRAADADAAILESALDLLEKRGYAGLSIDAVAAAAGVAKTTIYRRWPSKPALLAAAAAPLYQQLVEAPDTGSLRDDLVSLLATSRELMMGRAGRILQILLRESSQHQELTEPLQCALYERRQLYHRVLNRALARGELRADVDQDLVADMLLGPLWIRTMITPSPTPPELVRAAVDAILPGIRR
jgi:AcrR family transcriptional regulator